MAAQTTQQPAKKPEQKKDYGAWGSIYKDKKTFTDMHFCWAPVPGITASLDHPRHKHTSIRLTTYLEVKADGTVRSWIFFLELVDSTSSIASK